jgi:hypothetical protein
MSSRAPIADEAPLSVPSARCGVALSPARAGNGGLIVWPFHGNGPVAVELATGDAVVIHLDSGTQEA